MADSFGMTLKGIDFLPCRKPLTDVQRASSVASRFGDDKSNTSDLENQRILSNTAVFSSPTGEEYTTLPSTEGFAVIPWISGAPLNIDKDSPSEGGFFPIDRLDCRSNLTGQAGGPSRIELAATMLQLMRESGLPIPKSLDKLSKTDTPKTHTNAKSSPKPTPVSVAPTDPETSSNESNATAAESDSLVDKVQEQLPNIIIETAVGTLATAWVDGLSNPLAIGGRFFGDLGGGVMSAAIMTYAMSALGGKAPDASSSTFEWAKATAGPLLAGKLLSMGNWSAYLGAGPASPAPIRMDDIDSLGNPVLEGCPTVIVEGKIASTVGHKVKPPGIILEHGSMTVMIGGKFAARINDTVSKVSPFTMSSAVKTQIGGPTTNPTPPIPAKLQEWAQKLTDKNGKKVEDAGFRLMPMGGNKPTEPGYYFDPQALEWRIWDGQAWSLSVSEFDKLPDWGNFGLGSLAGLVSSEAQKWLDENVALRNLFGGTSEGIENWTLLGGLIDLGSPRFPGAGNAISWATPDSIFGLNMASIFDLHDWIFDPSNPKHGSLEGLWEIAANQQWPSLMALSTDDPRWNSSNPIHWFFQGVYFTATSIYGALAWADNYSQNWEESQGIPDQYGQLPHIRHSPYGANQNP